METDIRDDVTTEKKHKAEEDSLLVSQETQRMNKLEINPLEL